MFPTLFEVPGIGLRISTFGMMVALGYLFGSFVYGRLAAAGLQLTGEFTSSTSRDRAEKTYLAYTTVPIWILIGLVLGARLMYVVVEIAKGSETGKQFLADPFTIVAIWQGGLVMYGGFFGAVAAGSWCAVRHKLPLFHVMDIGAVGGFAGLAIGRIGCLLVGDDHGSIVPEAYRNLPFPITLRVPDPLPEQSLFGAENAGQVLWATQVWMSINAVLISLFAFWWLKRRHYPGQVLVLVGLLYAVTRGTIEAFRGDSVRGMWFDGAVSTSQLVSAVSGLAMLVLLVRFRKLRRAGPEPLATPKIREAST